MPRRSGAYPPVRAESRCRCRRLVILACLCAAAFGNFVAPYGADQRFDLAVYVPPATDLPHDDGKIYHTFSPEAHAPILKRCAAPTRQIRATKSRSSSYARRVVQVVRTHPSRTSTCSVFQQSGLGWFCSAPTDRP